MLKVTLDTWVKRAALPEFPLKDHESTDFLDAIRVWHDLQTRVPRGRDEAVERLGILRFRGRRRDIGKPKGESMERHEGKDI